LSLLDVPRITATSERGTPEQFGEETLDFGVGLTAHGGCRDLEPDAPSP
jgi:hypothetical protein